MSERLAKDHDIHIVRSLRVDPHVIIVSRDVAETVRRMDDFIRSKHVADSVSQYGTGTYSDDEVNRNPKSALDEAVPPILMQARDIAIFYALAEYDHLVIHLIHALRSATSLPGLQGKGAVVVLPESFTHEVDMLAQELQDTVILSSDQSGTDLL